MPCMLTRDYSNVSTATTITSRGIHELHPVAVMMSNSLTETDVSVPHAARAVLQSLVLSSVLLQRFLITR